MQKRPSPSAPSAMLSIVAVLIFYVIAAILAGEGILQPRAGIVRPHRIPLSYTSTFQSDDSFSFSTSSSFFTASFTVGRSYNLSLILSSSSADLLLRPNIYAPSPSADDLFYLGNGSFSLGGNATASSLLFEAMSDRLRIDGLRLPAFGFANMPPSADSDATGAARVKFLLPGNASGIIGLLPGYSGLIPKEGGLGMSWMQRLIDGELLPENRVALLLQVQDPASAISSSAGLDNQTSITAGQAGEMRLGSLDQDSIQGGRLVSTSLIDPSSSAIRGLLVAGKSMVIAEQQTLIFASGTEQTLGPKQHVAALFNATGVRSREEENGRLRGYYDCEESPKIGFAFPYDVMSGDASQNFYFDAQALGRDLGNGTCVAAIEGLASVSAAEQDVADRWIIGHSFMQGKYIDFNLDEQNIGVGLLRS